MTKNRIAPPPPASSAALAALAAAASVSAERHFSLTSSGNQGSSATIRRTVPKTSAEAKRALRAMSVSGSGKYKTR